MFELKNTCCLLAVVFGGVKCCDLMTYKTFVQHMCVFNLHLYSNTKQTQQQTNKTNEK